MIGSKNWLMALGSSAFLRYNNRLDFCLHDIKIIQIENKHNEQTFTNIFH